jgi:hypothetical protein
MKHRDKVAGWLELQGTHNTPGADTNALVLRAHAIAWPCSAAAASKHASHLAIDNNPAALIICVLRHLPQAVFLE